MSETPNNAVEKPEDFGTDGPDKVRYWMLEIERAKKRMENWHKDAKRVIEKYRNEQKNKEGHFNILWSNTETLKPALYSQTPIPNVQRRFKDKDQVTRYAAEVIERALSFSIDNYNFDGLVKRVVEDYVLPGRGVARVVYKPTMGMVTPKLPVTPHINLDSSGYQCSIYPEGTQFDEQGAAYMEGEPYEKVVYEEVLCQYWPYERFLHGEGDVWEEVPWECFESEYTREMLSDEFGAIGKKVPLDIKDLSTKVGTDEDTIIKKASVYEIWDKRTRKRIFIAPSYKERPLKEEDDPYKLQNFFPTPEPVYSVRTNNTLVPIPEFCVYEELADELDTLTDRILKITEYIKAAGITDAANDSIKRVLIDADDGEFIGVEGLVNTIPLEQQIMWFPVEQLAKVLAILVDQRERTKETIYEITGIADVIRGASNPNETATAQRLKGQFATLRLDYRQNDIERFARNLLRLTGELMVEQFSPETLQMITGMQIPPEVMAIIKSDEPRVYKIDIETDSTIAADNDAEKQQIIELMEATAQFAEAAQPMAQVYGVEFVKELILTAYRRFKIGSSLEDVLEQSIDQAQQNAQQQQPNPEMMKVQQDGHAEMQRIEADKQRDAGELQIKSQSQQESSKIEAAKAISDAELQKEKQQQDFALEKQKQIDALQLERQKQTDAFALEKYKISQEIDLRREIGHREADGNERNQAMQMERQTQADSEKQAKEAAAPAIPAPDVTGTIKEIAGIVKDVLDKASAPKEIVIKHDREDKITGAEVTHGA